MLFNSYDFLLIFLPVVLAGFALTERLGNRVAIMWLVTASLVFYSYWNPSYVVLLIVSIVMNFAIGKGLGERKSIAVLTVGITFNVGLIGYYKYANFFVDLASGGNGPFLDIFLPLGISFFTFQQITYLVDSYRRDVTPHSFSEYALFVSFFPQLIAGPIVHQKEILPQYTQKRLRLKSSNLVMGLMVFTVGLCKKVIIADGVAVYADPMFVAAEAGQMISFIEAWAGILAFSFQIYFDFSGYSDMAIGLALMFGIRLPINFASPYKATSIIDFWRRWHMTLSRFLRDYLYIPLGGSRRGNVRRYVNLIIVMVLGGLWHGAGLTFLIWGALHGVYLLLNHAWREVSARTGFGDRLGATPYGRLLSWALTFLCVVVAWVFFRAESFEGAFNILAGMMGAEGRLLLPVSYAGYLGPLANVFAGAGFEFVPWSASMLFSGITEIFYLSVVLAIVVGLPTTQECIRFAALAPDRRTVINRRPPKILFWRRSPTWAISAGVLFAGTMIWMSRDFNIAFVYFQF
jgi:alginate O-acetyltransferase complex protein AlgI